MIDWSVQTLIWKQTLNDGTKTRELTLGSSLKNTLKDMLPIMKRWVLPKDQKFPSQIKNENSNLVIGKINKRNSTRDYRHFRPRSWLSASYADALLARHAILPSFLSWERKIAWRMRLTDYDPDIKFGYTVELKLLSCYVFKVLPLLTLFLCFISLVSDNCMSNLPGFSPT